MINFLLNILQGMGSVLSVNSTPLYRYPYRQSAEALRGDWLKIGKDIESSLDLEGDKND